MSLLVGIGLAVAVGIFGTTVGFERDRAFYATVLIVVASFYALFAVMGGGPGALARESVPMAAFVLAAVVGFKRNLWILAAGLAGHGLFDMVHGSLIANPGVPAWWPAFCAAYDVTAGVYLGWRIAAAKLSAAPRAS